MSDDRRVPEDDRLDSNVGQQFDRLPATPSDRTVSGRASRLEVLEWWHDTFGVEPDVFEEFSFWEKGAGKIWIFADDTTSPIAVEAVGMTFMRTRQRHWKPTTNAVQRFGRHAQQNVLVLEGQNAAAFARGEDFEYADWDGDWGYVVVAHDLAGEIEPIGVGLYLYGELRSTIPKGRQESLPSIK
ncbi:MAG: DUF7122 family protein [Halobacteriota archaeon]